MMSSLSMNMSSSSSSTLRSVIQYHSKISRHRNFITQRFKSTISAASAAETTTTTTSSSLHIAGHGWTGAFGTGAQTILSYETSHVSPQDRENNFRLINDEANIDSIFSSSSSSSSSSSNDGYDTIINVAAGWGHTAIVCKNNNNNDTKLFVAGRPFDFQALLRLNRLPSFVRRGALSLSMKLDEENYWDKQGKKLISNFYNNNNNNNSSACDDPFSSNYFCMAVFCGCIDAVS